MNTLLWLFRKICWWRVPCFTVDCSQTLWVLIFGVGLVIHGGTILSQLVLKSCIGYQKPSVIMYRSFKNFIDDYFICDLYHLLESLNFDKSDGINTCFQTFIDCLNDIVNFHAPLKTKTIRKNNVPYINSEWWKMMYKRNMMRNIKNKHPCPENYDRYRNLRNQCVKIGKR